MMLGPDHRACPHESVGDVQFGVAIDAAAAKARPHAIVFPRLVKMSRLEILVRALRVLHVLPQCGAAPQDVGQDDARPLSEGVSALVCTSP